MTRVPVAGTPLAYIAKVTYGMGQPPPMSDDPDAVPILRATNIERGRITSTDLQRARLEDLPLDRAPLLRRGEILVVRSGAYTGDSALVTEEWSGSAPGYDLRLTPVPGAEPRFIAWALHSRPFLDQVELAKARAAQPHLNAQDLASIRIPLPPIGAQIQIADFLDAETDRIDELIEKCRLAVELLGERFWSLVHRLTHAGSDPAGTLMHPELGEVNPDWTVASLGRVTRTATDGPFGSSLTSSHYVEEGPRVIRLGNIGRGEFRNEDEAFISLEHYQSLSAHAVKPGDLLIAGLGDPDSSAPAGRACLVPEDFGFGIVKADCYRLRLTDAVRHDYMAWFLSAPQNINLVGVIARGATRPRMNLSLLSEIPVLIPPLESQSAIVDMIEHARGVRKRLIGSIQDEIDLLVERRQALITAAVTGNLDLGEYGEAA